MNTTYQTLIVKFSEPITASTRFTATDSHTAVITSEYNMEYVKEWLQRQTPIAEIREF